VERPKKFSLFQVGSYGTIKVDFGFAKGGIMNEWSSLMKKFLIIISCLFLLASCSKNASTTIDYTPYAEIPKDYSLEKAKADGLVVFENSDITSGQTVWDEFWKNTQDGTPCMVRLAYYYTLGDPSQYAPEYYEEEKDKYPMLFVHDLYFNGNTYTLFYIEEKQEYSFEYKYLKKFEETPESDTAIYSESIRYILVNDNDVTWEQIFRGIISSQYGAGIDHQTVYTKYIYGDT